MQNLKGVGIDLIDVDRIAKLKDNQRFLQRVFTAGELEYCFRKRFPERSLAARYAAKEAVGKALGTGIMNRYLRWKDVEVVRGTGKPSIKLHGPAGEVLEGAMFELSLTHTDSQAAAMVYFECKNFDEKKFRELTKK